MHVDPLLDKLRNIFENLRGNYAIGHTRYSTTGENNATNVGPLQFNLDDSGYAFAKYTPGLILPWHKDNYPTYARNKKANVEEIVRIMVFLHDPAPGHQLWIEDRYCTGPAGTWFSWQGATKHMAANLGETDRYVIQITGKSPK